MVLFEIRQRFKGHFLSELRVSFKNLQKIYPCETLFVKKQDVFWKHAANLQ